MPRLVQGRCLAAPSRRGTILLSSGRGGKVLNGSSDSRSSRLSGSRDSIVRQRGIAAPAPHQAVKGGKIGPGTTFSKKFARPHSCQLLRNSGCNELVDAGAILLCAALEGRYGSDLKYGPKSLLYLQ
jgi:hypothetical protein